MGNVFVRRLIVPQFILVITLAFFCQADVNSDTSIPGRIDTGIKFNPPDSVRSGSKDLDDNNRGLEGEKVKLKLLIPKPSGWTSQKFPGLTFYLETQSIYPIEITVIESGTGDTVAEQFLNPPINVGLHNLTQVDFKRPLLEKNYYQWNVAIVKNKLKRSQDVRSIFEVDRVIPSPEVLKKLQAANDIDKAKIFSDEGYWVDAFAALSSLPANCDIQKLQASLLDQIELASVALKLDKSLCVKE